MKAFFSHKKTSAATLIKALNIVVPNGISPSAYHQGIEKQILVYNEILFSNKKEWITDTWHNTNEPPEIMLSLKSSVKK